MTHEKDTDFNNEFESTYVKLFPYVQRFATKHLSSEYEADDLAQEVFVRLWKNFDRYEADKYGGYSSLAFRIARNLIVDHKRKKPILPLEDNLERLPSATIINTEDVVIGRQESLKIEEAINSLPNSLGEIVSLRYYFEMTHSEIANALGISEVSSRCKLLRAKKALKRKFGESLL